MTDTSLPMGTLLERLELLLDDELEDSERSELLHYLESIPDGWRICAAMFLEAQTVKRSIQEGFGKYFPAADMPEAVFEHKNDVSVHPGMSQSNAGLKDGGSSTRHVSAPKAVDRPEADFEHGKLKTISLRQVFAVSTLVGFLAILFTIMSIRLFDPASEATMDRWIASLPENWEDANPYELPTTKNAGLKTVGSPKKTLLSFDSNHEIELPLFDCQSVDPAMFYSYCSVSPASLEPLRRTGLEVSVRRCDEIIKLEDGSKVIVPVETVYVRKRDGKSHTRNAGVFTVYGPGVVFSESDCTERIADFMRQSPPCDCQDMKLVMAFDPDEKLNEYHFTKGTAKWEIRSFDDLPADMRTKLENAIRGCIPE